MRRYLPANLFGEKTFYIVSSGFVSVVGFLKSLIFLRYFGFGELGLINLCQNFIISISLLQLGVVTGSYRLFSYKSEAIRARINSSVLAYFFVLSAVLLIAGMLVVTFFHFDVAWYWILYFVLTGALGLYANWVNCKLIAQKRIKVLNIANLISAVVSLTVVFLVGYIGVVAALSSFALQSIVLITYAYIAVPSMAPRIIFKGAWRYLKRIISIGFVPYLTTAIGFFNSQFGRWIITISLGTFMLGKTSLVVLYSALVNVFPNALSNLFFPDLIAQYETGRIDEFKFTLKRYFLVIGSYVGGTIVLTVLLGEWVVGLVFPKHLEALPLVYAVMPSLALLLAMNPVVIVLNATRKFKEILYGSLISVASYLTFVAIYVSYFQVQLIGFFVIESISSLCFFVYNYFVFVNIWKHGISRKNDQG